MVTYLDLQSPKYSTLNPLKKVPAMLDASGNALFESYVIMQYIEDKFKFGHSTGAMAEAEDGGAASCERNLMADSPEKRAFVELLVRVHDLYIASPNCSQPSFSHTQGAMYLAPKVTPHCTPERVMKRETRAAKVAELWKQLSWLELQASDYAVNPLREYTLTAH